MAPPGQHLMSMFVQYAPYALREGDWDQLREAFADRCFALLDEYAPNFRRSVLARQVLTPLDLERTFGLTGGNIFQGAMTPSQLFSFRPVPGWPDTPATARPMRRRSISAGRPPIRAAASWERAGLERGARRSCARGAAREAPPARLNVAAAA